MANVVVGPRKECSSGGEGRSVGGLGLRPGSSDYNSRLAWAVITRANGRDFAFSFFTITASQESDPCNSPAPRMCFNVSKSTFKQQQQQLCSDVQWGLPLEPLVTITHSHGRCQSIRNTNRLFTSHKVVLCFAIAPEVVMGFSWIIHGMFVLSS